MIDSSINLKLFRIILENQIRLVIFDDHSPSFAIIHHEKESSTIADNIFSFAPSCLGLTEKRQQPTLGIGQLVTHLVAGDMQPLTSPSLLRVKHRSVYHRSFAVDSLIMTTCNLRVASKTIIVGL